MQPRHLLPKEKDFVNPGILPTRKKNWRLFDSLKESEEK